MSHFSFETFCLFFFVIYLVKLVYVCTAEVIFRPNCLNAQEENGIPHRGEKETCVLCQVSGSEWRVEMSAKWAKPQPLINSGLPWRLLCLA